jgi:hypothetical protein
VVARENARMRSLCVVELRVTVNKLKYCALRNKDPCGEIYVADNSKPSFGLHVK